MRNAIYNQIRKQIEPRLTKTNRYIVGIDGIDVSGKTTFAIELKDYFKTKGYKSILIHLDNFHNTSEIRYKKGNDSAEGFYKDSYNYKVLIFDTLFPFLQHHKCIKTSQFDVRKNILSTQYQNIENVDFMILEGIFLHRAELENFFDYSIFLDISFDNSLKRNIERESTESSDLDINQFGKRHKTRYEEGQKLYLNQNNPKEKANLIINNNNIYMPKII